MPIDVGSIKDPQADRQRRRDEERGSGTRSLARPSGAGDNYRSRVSKQPSVPWRHQIISLIRGTLIII